MNTGKHFVLGKKFEITLPLQMEWMAKAYFLYKCEIKVSLFHVFLVSWDPTGKWKVFYINLPQYGSLQMCWDNKILWVRQGLLETIATFLVTRMALILLLWLLLFYSFDNYKKEKKKTTSIVDLPLTTDHHGKMIYWLHIYVAVKIQHWLDGP